MGSCLDNQAFAANGDALQHTTGGLLVWRKSDNWTAFSDGYRTWVAGPYGLQDRLNTDRFSWESAQPSATPTPQSTLIDVACQHYHEDVDNREGDTVIVLRPGDLDCPDAAHSVPAG